MIKIIEVEDGIKIDVKSLEKGDWISPTFLGKMFKIPHTDSRYDLMFERFKRRVQGESEDDGEPLLCRMEARGMSIMTDEEALYYKQKQHRSTVYRLSRINHEICLIDNNNLCTESKEVLSSELLLQDLVVQAVNKVMG